MNNTHFDFTTHHGESIVFVELPLVESFGYRFDYRYHVMGGLIRGEGHAHFVEKQTLALATIGFEATELGHLYP